MDSEIKTGPDVLETFDYDTLNVEDCQHILRSLERRAFEHVVCALRAQGPLSEYKEVILDHLKSLFFISDDDFLLHLRLCANDPVLSKIAETLNPSYDNSSEWLASGYNVMLFDLPKLVQLNTSIPNKTTCSIAEQMRLQMAQHNSRIEDECQAMLKLIRLKKKPYVPEKLRRLLRDTENDVQNRVDVYKPKSIAKTAHRVGRPPRRFESAAADSTSSKTKSASKLAKIAAKAAKQPAVRTKSPAVEASSANNSAVIEVPSESVPSTSTKANTRPTRAAASKVAATVVKDEPATTDFAPAEKLSSPKPPTVFNTEPAPACTPEPSTTVPNPMDVQPDKSPPINGAAVQQQQQIAAQRPVVKVEEIENHKAVDEFSIHYSGGANVVVVDPEDQNTTKEPKVRKRRSKVVDDVTCTCARVHPFTFEPAVGDIPKPPRGNPDKRCSKLKTSKRGSGSNDLNAFNYIPQQPLATNYYLQKNVSYYNSAPAASDIHPLKRSRTSSMHDEANLLFQKPVHHPRVINAPLNVLTTPSYSSTSRPPYYGGGSSGQQASPVMMGADVPTPSYAPANEYEMNYVGDRYYSSSAPTRMLAPPPQPSHVVDGDIVIAGYAPARSDVVMEDTYGGVEPALYAKDTRPVHLPVTSPVIPKSTYRRYVSREVVDSNKPSAQLVSSNSASEPGSRQVVEHPLNASRSLSNVEQTMDNAVSVSASIMTSSMDPPQTTTSSATNGEGNATGLDFLASTASLLIPMQTAEPQSQDQNFYVGIPDQTQQQPLFRDNSSSSYVNVTSAGPSQPQQIIYVQSVPSAPPMQESSQAGVTPTTVSITYYTTEASPIASISLPNMVTSSAVNTENLILPGRSLQQSTNWPMQSSLTAITSGSTSYIPSAASNHAENVEQSNSQAIAQITSSTSVTSTTTFSSSAPQQQQKSQFTDNEAAQNFLKQHASLVDTNGLPLNEELTLGSIIRSSNLRNKLFSTASKSSASPSPGANSPSAIPTTASAVNLSTLPSTSFSVLPSQLTMTTFSASAPTSCGDSSLSNVSNQAMSGVTDQKVQSLPYSATTQSGAGEIALSAPQNSASAVTTTAVNTSLVNRPN